VKLPTFLEGLPRTAYLIAIPAIAFIVTIGVVLATSGGGDDDNKTIAAVPTVKLSQNNLDVAPTAAPTAAPPIATAVAEPNRADCTQIRGTDYQSGTEREWYLANCTGSTNTASSSGGGGGGGTAAATGGGGGGHVTGTEYALGARLVIPSISLNAVVTGMDVGASGAMPDPNGYDNVVQYKFPSHPGLGGTNKVIAGHVDCGRCRNGGSGTAVFWYIRNLGVGASAQYIGSDGSVTNYVVTTEDSVPDGSDSAGIVAEGAADMTLITCTGTFSSGSYNNRFVVQLRLA
jgi:hypothetical protein